MKKEIASQYRASLKMLLTVIDRCPDHLWNDKSYSNTYWQIAYHTLHYTSLYLSESLEKFITFANHISGYHVLGEAIPDQKDEAFIPGFAKQDLLQFGSEINAALENHVESQDLTGPSGFDWLNMNRFELNLYNIRHIQHHTGQLVECLHQHGISGINWIDTGKD